MSRESSELEELGAILISHHLNLNTYCQLTKLLDLIKFLQFSYLNGLLIEAAIEVYRRLS